MASPSFHCFCLFHFKEILNGLCSAVSPGSLPLASYGADCSCAGTQCPRPPQTMMLRTQFSDWQACYMITSMAHLGLPFTGPLANPMHYVQVWQSESGSVPGPLRERGEFGLEMCIEHYRQGMAPAGPRSQGGDLKRAS